MDKNTAVKIIKNEVEIILNEYRINYVIGLDDNDIIIACTNKDTAQFIYANLKSRYDDKKYWEYISEIFVKHNYIVHHNYIVYIKLY